MSSLLSKQAFDLINSLKTSLLAHNLGSTIPVKKDYNWEITASQGADKCKILVYFGKKGVKTVLQGNEFSPLYKQIESIIEGKDPRPAADNYPDEPDEYIGTDESGKGDIFGPLVIAAVFVEQDTIPMLVKAGVRDSKEIKNGKINNIAASIMDIVGNNFAILTLAPPQYNTLYNKYLNLNKLLNYAHSLVIEELLAKTDCHTIITDQFSKRDLTVSANPHFAHKKFIQLPKGEKYTGVAAASILARNAFEQWFIEKEKEGYSLLKGASAEVERNAANIMRTFGPETLLNLTKNHFKPVKNLI